MSPALLAKIARDESPIMLAVEGAFSDDESESRMLKVGGIQERWVLFAIRVRTASSHAR